MGYTCNVCKKSFSRCAFLVHNSDSKCNPAPKEVLPVRPRPSTSTSFEQVEQSLPSTSSNADPSAPTVLQNGSLFMVVHLNNEETRSRPYANLTEVDIRHEESTTTTDNKKSYESNEDNASDFIEDLFDLLPEAAEEQQLQNVDVLFDIAPDLVENVAIVVEQVNPIEVAPTEEHQQMETAESNLEHNNTAALLEETDEAPKGFTKNGNPRKRAAPRCKEDIKSKREKNKDKHALQPPCNNTCKRKCTTKLTEHRRMKIHEHFWAMEENERKVFILGHIDKSKVKRKTHPEEESRRGKTFFYFLTDSDGARKMVCKTFFLSTLGYKKNNDMFITNVLNKSTDGVLPKRDQRGRHPPHNLVDRSIIKDHILKYNPCISHYRREHAPNRKYLPCELSIAKMHEELMKDHEAEENFHCSYDLYRNVISEMNISFAKLGHEECERCEKYNLHKQDHGQIDELLCPECNEWKDHKKKYTEAREAYEKSIDKDNLDSYRPSGTVVYTMDLQKVIMLPHIEQFKEAVFTRRIVLFNESFVPVGEKPTMDPFACIWHEGISGRKKEDIASALNSFIMHKRDAKKIHIWMDNCAAQNKNWALFSYLTGLVNSNDIEANEIVLNYLETGHTFMSADHFHHQVNKQIKSKGKMYDFEDFKDAVKASNSGKVTVKSMEHQDFFTEFNYSSQYKIMHKVPRPYLSEMVHVLFQRGSFDMFYRKSFSGEVFQLFFLKAGFTKKREVPKPNTRTSPRGVNKEKKQDIIKKLVPLMPPNRHGFWVDLAVSEEPDLITEHDID